MLKINSIGHSKLITFPYRHAIINNFIDEQTLTKLIDCLPLRGYKLSKRLSGSDKTYLVKNNILHELGAKQSSNILEDNQVWSETVEFLLSPVYHTSLAKLLQVDLQSCHVEITLKCYGDSNYISPHTDRSSVVATHLIFLNKRWLSDWGGQLCIMSSPTDIFAKITSVYTNSVAFVRSDNSWHSVTPCRNNEEDRIVLQVAFWNNLERELLPGREEIDLLY